MSGLRTPCPVTGPSPSPTAGGSATDPADRTRQTVRASPSWLGPDSVLRAKNCVHKAS